MKPELSAIEALLQIAILRSLCEQGILSPFETNRLCRELEIEYMEKARQLKTEKKEEDVA